MEESTTDLGLDWIGLDSPSRTHAVLCPLSLSHGSEAIQQACGGGDQCGREAHSGDGVAKSSGLWARLTMYDDVGLVSVGLLCL